MEWTMSLETWKMMRSIALACLCFGVVVATPVKAQPIWTWANQYGSTVSVNSFDQNTGAISGTYTNNASNSCDEGVPQAATGWLAQTSQASDQFYGELCRMWLDDRLDRAAQFCVGFSGTLAALTRRAGSMEWHQRRRRHLHVQDRRQGKIAIRWRNSDREQCRREAVELEKSPK